MNDPFKSLSLPDLDAATSAYPAIERQFNFRCREWVSRGLSFYELPRLYQWLLIPSGLAPLKLAIIDRCLDDLYGRDTQLNKQIKRLDTFRSDNQVFNFLTEFLVISNLLSRGVCNFAYEEFLVDHAPRFDANFDFDGKRVRLDITHKEDVYPLEQTAGTLSINLEYASPDCGGHIDVAPPTRQNYHDGSIIHSVNFSDKELRTTIEMLLETMRSLPAKKVSVPCSNPSFKLTVDPNSQYWRRTWSRTDESTDIQGYLSSIRRKAHGSRLIRDSSYMILALDFNPDSHFHKGSPFRTQLGQELAAFDLSTSSNFSEVTTFSMRLETGQFENADSLWCQGDEGSIFLKLIGQ